MGEGVALKVAIDLMSVPSRVRMARSQPLPTGVSTLLRIAAGEEAAESAAITATGRSSDVIRRAAGFFIEQVMFCPNADSYRVLGASADATSTELRHNMALLMRWLHPDLDPQGLHSVFASRVTLAWNDLKTAERRALYDLGRPAVPAKTPLKKSKRSADGKRRQSAGRSNGFETHAQVGRERNLLRRLIAWMTALTQPRLG